MKKGLELPINVLVVVAVAVLVLLGIIALFLGGFGGGSNVIQMRTAQSVACGELQDRGCGTTNPSAVHIDYDTSGNGNVGSEDNLQTFCNDFRGCKDYVGNETLCCKVIVCGCSGLPRPQLPTTP